ncbi:hypothetical protein NE237_009863 [Protea cynaroides]|uniref:CBM20 domain-containing protein n=1 Tax=Protea cynaroides TaxID=273540 RepID=A0A9Q0KYH8_9MAGN|nr:hypothetical protein NE237_009863 [Protea cynaroides]
MEALTSYSSKIFAESSTGRAYVTSRTLSNRPQRCFFRSLKLVSIDFSPSFPLQFKAIESLGFSCFSSEIQVGWETADDQPQETSQSKTVHVKFQLQKQCMFGQRFLLVGDNPIFGLWDPSDAIPLEWSDGHIWTLELDLPVGKTVHFKFILEGTSGEVVWQPGPDRIVQTWDTDNTIIVLDDWENSELQKITEELMTNPIMESVAIESLHYPNVEGVAEVNERLIVAENIFCPKEEPMASECSELIDSEYINPKEDPVVTAGNKLIVAENISYPKDYMADLDKDLQTTENITYSQQETLPNAYKEFIIAQSTSESNGGVINSIDESQGIYEGGCVLVPGLTPFPTMTTQDSSPQLVEEGICEGRRVLVPGSTSLPTMTTQDSSPQLVEEGNNNNGLVQACEADDNSAPEKNQLTGKQESGGHTHREERNMMMLNDEPEGDMHVDQLEENPQITKEQDSISQPTNGEDGDANILRNDIQWGRNTLRKFLTILGFL